MGTEKTSRLVRVLFTGLQDSITFTSVNFCGASGGELGRDHMEVLRTVDVGSRQWHKCKLFGGKDCVLKFP